MNRYTDHVQLPDGRQVGYSPTPRTDRGKWIITFTGPTGGRVRVTTVHDVRGTAVPAVVHDEAKRAVRLAYDPPTLFPDVVRKTWDELLGEVERVTTASEDTWRQYRAGAKAFTPHGLRRRAVTLTVQAVGSVDAAAAALGLTAQTARSHYADLERAFGAADVMARVADALRPRVLPPICHQPPADGAKTPGKQADK